MALKHIYKNIGASVLPQVVNIVSSFVLPTMIIAAFGSQINGLISTIKSIVSYISLVGAGISVATIQSLYLPVANNDNVTVRGMLKATDQMFSKCGWIYLLITFVVALTYPLIIETVISYSSMVWLILVISISGASEFFAVGTCRSLLYADRKTYVCTTIQAISLFISLVCGVVLLKLDVNIVYVQLGISLVYIARAILLKVYVHKQYPLYRYTRNTIPIKRAVEKRNDAMIHQLSGLAVTATQTIILSLMVGLEAASIYAVYNIIFSGIASICANINGAITPFIGRSLATKSIKTVEKEYDIVEYGFHLLSTFIFAVTAVMIVPFVVLYTSGADINYAYDKFALLFVVVQIFNVKRLPNNALINAAGHFKETKYRAIIEAVICVVCSISFTYLYGMYGVLLGTGCALGWRCLDIIYYSNKHILQCASIKSVMRLIRTLIIIALLYVVSDKYVLTSGIESYAIWIEYAVIVSVFSVIFLLLDALLFERKTANRLVRILLTR